MNAAMRREMGEALADFKDDNDSWVLILTGAGDKAFSAGMDLKEMIGARIREIRTKRGFTQEALSEKMGVNPKYLSSIERGKENPTLNTLVRLSESLEVEIGEIFGFVESEDPAEAKSRIVSLLDEADEEQVKLISKMVSLIVH